MGWLIGALVSAVLLYVIIRLGGETRRPGHPQPGWARPLDTLPPFNAAVTKWNSLGRIGYRVETWPWEDAKMPKRSFSIPRPVQYVVLGVAIVAAGAMVWSAFQPLTPPVSSSTREALQPEDFATTEPDVQSVVFIGDSYTQGTGASSEATRWASLVATAQGWDEVNLGRGGTGYVTTSDVNGCGEAYCPNYQEMVGEAVSANPDVVVVAGGQNDFDEWQADPVAQTAAIGATLSAIRSGLPNAEIIVVGPSTPGNVNNVVSGMSNAVAEQAGLIGATFVSLIDPPVISSDMVIADGAHVRDSGHQAIADRVLSALG